MAEDTLNGIVAVVTGGLGFIGSNLALHLSSLGCEVRVIDSLIPECGGDAMNAVALKGKATVFSCDLRGNAELAPALRDVDVVFNLAGHVSHTGSMSNPFLDMEINCSSQLSLLEACRKECDGAKIIFAGTRASYGKAERLPVSENNPARPVDINGANKHAAELYHLIYARAYGLNTVVLKLTNVYGPRHAVKNSSHGFMNWFIRLALEGKEIRVFGGGSQKRDLLFAGDAVSAFEAAASRRTEKGSVFNIGTGKATSILEAAQSIIRIAGSGTLADAPYSSSWTGLEVGDFVMDASKAHTELGWEAQTSLGEGLKTTVEYYRSNSGYYWWVK